MKKIIFPILAAAMLMSFVAVDSETSPKVKATKQVKAVNCNSYVMSGNISYYHGPRPTPLVTIITPSGFVIQRSGAFSEVVPVVSGNPATATIISNGFDIFVNGAQVVCSDGTTEVQFWSNGCYFTGGSCGDQF